MEIKTWNFQKNSQGWWQDYYSPQGPEMFDLYRWCLQMYGPAGDRWKNHGGWIQFKTQEDLTLFLLKWS